MVELRQEFLLAIERYSPHPHLYVQRSQSWLTRGELPREFLTYDIELGW